MHSCTCAIIATDLVLSQPIRQSFLHAFCIYHGLQPFSFWNNISSLTLLSSFSYTNIENRASSNQSLISCPNTISHHQPLFYTSPHPSCSSQSQLHWLFELMKCHSDSIQLFYRYGRYLYNIILTLIVHDDRSIWLGYLILPIALQFRILCFQKI